jgi:hypothetical protein
MSLQEAVRVFPEVLPTSGKGLRVIGGPRQARAWPAYSPEERKARLPLISYLLRKTREIRQFSCCNRS